MPAPGPIARFLAADHARLDALLERALSRPGEVDLAAFGEFRAGLLRHIGIEEKILLPAAREARGGEPLPLGRRLRVDHGAITSLLVGTPTHALAAELRSILGPHNLAEEEPGGLYEACDALLPAADPRSTWSAGGALRLHLARDLSLSLEGRGTPTSADAAALVLGYF